MMPVYFALGAFDNAGHLILGPATENLSDLDESRAAMNDGMRHDIRVYQITEHVG